MLLDHRFCLTTLVASNHEPGVTLRAIANNGRQTRTLEPVGRTSRVCDPGQSLRPGGIDSACRRLAHGPSSFSGTQSHVQVPRLTGCRLADACNGIPDRLPVGRPGLPQSNKAGGKETLTGLSATKCHPGLSVLV